VPGSAQPAFGGDKLARPIDWTMACPDAAGGAELRILFGSIYPADHPAYSGPPANGTFASDGLFLYVLGPGQVGAGSQIRVQASGGTLDVAASTFDQTLESGDRQDSGCRVA
jgi:hypothetical protein